MVNSDRDEIGGKINETNSIMEADPLHSELRIVDWILYQVSSNEIKRLYSKPIFLKLYILLQ